MINQIMSNYHLANSGETSTLRYFGIALLVAVVVFSVSYMDAKNKKEKESREKESPLEKHFQ